MSRTDDTYITLLKAKQVQHALTSVTNPVARDSFEYGRVSGFLQGLLSCEAWYLELISEKEKRSNESKSTD